MMKNKIFQLNGKMRIEYVYLIRYCFTGILWIFYGIFSLKSQDSFLYSNIARVLMVVAGVCILSSFVLKHENANSYAKEYLAKASEIVLAIFSFVIMVLICFIPFVKEMSLDLKQFLPFALGIILFSVGLIFEYLEETLIFEKK